MRAEESKPKKSLGQHWLHDESALQAICGAAQLTPNDTVLEVGPGTGTLTRELIKRAGHVVAVEFDADLAAKLASLKIATKLQIIEGDILRFDLGSLPADYKVVANIPYYLTSKLIRQLSETPNRASLAVLLVQKEVAQRVAAKPGNMSLLSVSAQFYWEISLARIVPAKLFAPPPKIDSQILIMERRKASMVAEIDTRQYFRVVRSGFAARRKTLLNSLTAGLRIEKEQTRKLLLDAGINPGLRPQALSLYDWYAIYLSARKCNIL